MLWRACLLTVVFAAGVVRLHAAGRATSYSRMDAEELLFGEIEVTSVSKKPEKLSRAPAAVHVITSEDIRRTGHKSIAEALRLVPGMAVGRIDSSGWAVSTRGFNGRYNGKMLVLIDGRSVYTPLFGGVWWDQQDVPLEDVDRIEVIRGPGGTLWGANALNGVINIVTKKARDTQGGLLSASDGIVERGSGQLRYGGRAGNTHYRVYGRWNTRD
ncbi:MAG: TonB-dependent receptor plug domain-containing protein, partial [Elusimicrobia bacterium]|nr:TonB-dependent receptor plug domain-containing protein [Elusimicrobiota bacterium]